MPTNGCQKMDANKWMPTNAAVKASLPLAHSWGALPPRLPNIAGGRCPPDPPPGGCWDEVEAEVEVEKWMPKNGCVEVEVEKTTFKTKSRRRALGPS